MTNLSGANLYNGVAVDLQGEGSESPSAVLKYPAYKDSGVEWLGEVPEHWKLMPLKHLALLNPRKSGFAGDTKQLCSFVPMEKLKTGVVQLDEERPIEEVIGGYTYFEDGDVLQAKVTPCFENMNVAIAKGLTNGIGFGSSEINVLRPFKGVNTEYLYYRVQEGSYMSFCTSSMIGAGGLKRVPTDVINSFKIAAPELFEQTQIARFLDHETARMDALIEEQQRLIELLKEKRQAVISHAVTKGLDPTVPMKDSGVEWLGEVPAHWTVCQVRHLMAGDTRNGLYKPEGDKDSEGVGFVQMGEAFNDRVFQGGVKDRVRASSTELKNWGLEEGDLLFARRSIVLEGSGRCTRIGSLNEPHLFESSMIRVRLDVNRVSSEYLHYMFDSVGMRAQVLSTTKTVTISGIDSGQLKGLRLAVPSKCEQENIAAYLYSSIEAFVEAERIATVATSLLNERRSALISAAVTGKIDVRDWQPPATVRTHELVQEAV